MRKFLMILAVLFISIGIASCGGNQKITIIFEENGGVEVDDIEIDATTTELVLPTTTKEGFTFDGWFLDSELTSPWTITALITQSSSVTLYAKWTENVVLYTITFEVNGGSTVASITQGSGTTISAPAAPTKEGYTFDGWYTDQGLTTAYTFTNMPAQNITLYAKWVVVITTSTITFESNGGSAVNSITANIGSAVNAPSAPTKEGYTFGGWYSDIGLTTAYAFTTMPAQNITLYAKWTLNNYTITFETNGGSLVTAIEQGFGTTVTSPTPPTKEGYTFDGWYSDIGLTTAYTFTTMPAQNITLYAKWTLNNYTITFEVNGGSLVTDITQGYNSSVTAPTPPTKEGYTFGGWYSDIGLNTAYAFTTMPAQNITLYAKWTLNNYTISFEENGGSLVTAIEQGFGTTITAPTPPTKEGYTFDGWYTDTGLLTAYTFTTMPSQHMTLYAKWTLNNYTITFETNGGSLVTDITQGYNSSVTAPTPPTKEGYTFDGWYTDTGLTTAYTFTTMPSQHITLHAKWVIRLYTITIHNLDEPFVLYYEAGDELLFDIPERTGYYLVGVYTDAFMLVPFEDEFMPTKDINLYTQWEALNYIVIFETYGANEFDEKYFPYNSVIEITQVPVKEGYHFLGWYFDEDFLVPLNGQRMPAEEVVLYAKWVAIDAVLSISDILKYRPSLVTVYGTIVYKFSSYPEGFYIADETGIIYVAAPNSMVTVGDVVTLDASFIMFDMTFPHLVNMTHYEVDVEGISLELQYVETMISDITQQDVYDVSVFGQPIIITGVLTYETVGMFGAYFIAQPGSGEKIAINHKSYHPSMNPFTGHVGEKITIAALQFGYDAEFGFWHVVYDSTIDPTYMSLTDEDKVQEILDFAYLMLNGMSFYGGSFFELPAQEGLYNATLLFETVGDYADLYNVEEGRFEQTDIEVVITLRLTVTLNQAEDYIDLSLILKPQDVLSIAEFKMLDDGGSAIVEGIVVFKFSVDKNEIIILADEYGDILPVQLRDILNLGDRVLLSGIKMTQDGFVMMFSQREALVDVIETHVPNPLEPIHATADQFAVINPMNSMYWGQYFEISGTLEEDTFRETLNIVGNFYEVSIMMVDRSQRDFLLNFVGLDVRLRGFALPNFDDDPYIMFFYLGGEGELMIDMDPIDLLNEVGLLLQTKLESMTFYPGQSLNLPMMYQALGIEISYEVALDDAYLIDGQMISADIEEENWITMIATITMGEFTINYDIELNVKPLTITSISDLYLVGDWNLYFVEAVVIYIDPKDHFMLVADETGIIMVTPSMDASISIGDLLLLHGAIMRNEDMVFLTNDPELIVSNIIAHDQEIPQIPNLYTVAELMTATPVNPIALFEYVEIIGTLNVHQDEYGLTYYISDDSENMVMILLVNDINSTQLASNVEEEVRVKGLWMNMGSMIGFQIIIFLDLEGDVNPMYTDQQLLDMLAIRLTNTYDNKVLRPGITHQLPNSFGQYDVMYTYETEGPNASLYNVITGEISDTITELTYITVTAEIALGDISVMVTFDLIIEPIIVSTIETFLNQDVGVDMIVSGVVVIAPYGNEFIMIADDTGYLFLTRDLDVAFGDYIVVSGVVSLSQGLKVMSPHHLGLIEVVEHHQENPLTPTAMSITDLLNLPVSYGQNAGLFVELTGYMIFVDHEPRLYTESDGIEYVVLEALYLTGKYDEIYNNFRMHEHLVVKVYGFVFADMMSLDPTPSIAIPSETYLSISYVTDQEKMDALYEVGKYHLESNSYYPYDELSLPLNFPILDATIEWLLLGDVSSVIDEETMTFLEVNITTIIQLRATVTIGSLTDELIFNITVEPLPIYTLDEFCMLDDGEYGRLEVYVVQEIGYYRYILGEVGGTQYLIASGYEDLIVNTLISIYGQKNTYNGATIIDGFVDSASYIVLDTITPEPLVPQEISLASLLDRDQDSAYPMNYYTVKGRFIYDESNGTFYLTDGLRYMYIVYQDDQLAVLDALVDQDVVMHLFNYEVSYAPFGDIWSGVISNFENDVTAYIFSDLEVVNIMNSYIQHILTMYYKDGLSYLLPISHPFYGGSYLITVDPQFSSEANIVDHVIHLISSQVDYTITLDVVVTYNTLTIENAYDIIVYAYEPMLNFTPEASGIPKLFDTSVPGTFAGLYVGVVERRYGYMSEVDLIVDVWFPYPEDLNCEYFMIQYYDTATQSWVYIEDEAMEPIRSYWNNFSLKFTYGLMLRVVTNTGLISNTVSFEYTDIDTYFAGYYVEMSMWLTGMMFPFVGSALNLDSVTIFTVDGIEVEDAYTVQWYRVNPYTFAETLIPNATDHMYITTLSDVGYYMMFEVKGDGINAGGMMREIIQVPIKVFNHGQITSATNMGFDISFAYQVSIQELNDYLNIKDGFNQDIEILSITPTDKPYTYHVNLVPGYYYQYIVSMETDFMVLGSVGEYQFMMQGITQAIYQ